MEFFRFPRTPHLVWLGKGKPRDDKVLPPGEVRDLLAHELLVEEKIDGANLGLSVDEQGALRAQNRGKYLSREHHHPQFKPLFRWLASRERRLAEALSSNLMLFGEWCYAVHSVRYTRLPDWFLVFDVYDRERGHFWSAAQRDALAVNLSLAVVPRLGRGVYDMGTLHALLGQSQVGDGPAEGLYLRRDAGDRLVARAKLVRSEFAQAIDQHWSKRTLQTNELASFPSRETEP
jgi:RNA ligase-like protein